MKSTTFTSASNIGKVLSDGRNDKKRVNTLLVTRFELHVRVVLMNLITIQIGIGAMAAQIDCWRRTSNANDGCG